MRNATISPKTGTKANATAPRESGPDPASGSHFSDGRDLGGTGIGWHHGKVVGKGDPNIPTFHQKST